MVNNLLLCPEHLFEIAVLMHFGDDVAAADEFAVDKDLRNGRPVGVFFDALSDLFAGKDVVGLECGVVGF